MVRGDAVRRWHHARIAYRLAIKNDCSAIL